MTKIIGVANSCKECPNRHYYSGGTYECLKVQGSSLNADSSIPTWCPLSDYPAAAPAVHRAAGQAAPSQAPAVDGTKATLSVEQRAALDLAVLNLMAHGDDQLLAALKPLIALVEQVATPQQLAEPAQEVAQGDERVKFQAEIDRLRNELAAAKQDASTAWERHAMANRISTALQDGRAALAGRLADAEADAMHGHKQKMALWFQLHGFGESSDERAAFDMWARNCRLDANVSLEGHYTDAATAYAWAAWRARATTPQAAAMPTLTDAMRGVLRNERDLYGSEDELYAALCVAAGERKGGEA